MAEAITLARPYAKAIFGLAQQAGDFAGWSDALGKVTAVVTNPAIAGLLNSPQVTPAELASSVNDVVGKLGASSVSDKVANFVSLLAENRRLGLIADIAAQFEVMRNEAENSVDAVMRSATQPTDAQIEAIRLGLEKKLGRDVKLSVVVDESLLGGALIKAGDLVIDGTVKTKLARLGSALTNASA